MERGDGGIQLRQVHVIDPDQKVKVRSGEAYVNKAYEGSEVWRYYKSVPHMSYKRFHESKKKQKTKNKKKTINKNNK
jgi:hypothetical protein